MKEETKGLYLAILLSAIAILAVNWIWPAQEVVMEEKPVAEIKVQESTKKAELDKEVYTSENRKVISVADALKQDKRIEI